MTIRQLISAVELAAIAGDADVVVFDTRHDLADPGAGRLAFDRGHIPGSLHLHLDHDLSGARSRRVSAGGQEVDGGRHPLPSAELLRDRLETLGVGDRTRIVAVDAHGGMFAARLWWLARWLGHANVAVLDGGLPAWTAAGLPLETGPGRPVAERGVLSSRPSLSRSVDIDAVVANLANGALRLVDARAPDRFRGENETLDPVGGHIPGAGNRFFRDNLRPDGAFKPGDELALEWARHVADPAGTVLYCGSGVTACHNLLALEIAGLGGAGLYGGSWSEWVSDGSRPVER